MSPLSKTNSLPGKIVYGSIAVVFASLIYDLGWPIDSAQRIVVGAIYQSALVIHLLSLIWLFFCRKQTILSKRQLITQLILSTLILGVIHYGDIFAYQEDLFSKRQASLTLTGILIGIPLFSSISYLMEWLAGGGVKKTSLPPALLFLLTLICLAFSGALLLLMPNCTFKHDLSFIDALFTSTSAVCVTGLSPINIHDTLTPLGQLVLLVLIQLGGFGIMTFAYFIAMMLGQGISLRDKVLIRDLLNEETLNSTTSFLRNLILFTFIIELTGAALLYLFWENIAIPGDQPLFWHALFHAVSAFCNAGFSTFQDGLGSDFIVYNRAGEAVIMCLIVFGGLGFVIFKEFGQHIKHRFDGRRHHHKLRWTTHFSLATQTTFYLIAGGMLCIFISSASTPAFGSQPWTTTLWNSLFYSVSSRTAGFNIDNLAEYSSAAALVMCALMMIGGSPGGTAGGVRTTTFAVVLGELSRIVRGRRDVEFNGRSIAHEVVERSVAVVILSGAWVGATTMLCCYLEPGLSSLDLFFENVSAFTTTGLSRNLTPMLTAETKAVLILNMIAGRVGIFSFVLALAGTPSPRHYRYPSTKLPLN